MTARCRRRRRPLSTGRGAARAPRADPPQRGCWTERPRPCRPPDSSEAGLASPRGGQQAQASPRPPGRPAFLGAARPAFQGLGPGRETAPWPAPPARRRVGPVTAPLDGDTPARTQPSGRRAEPVPGPVTLRATEAASRLATGSPLSGLQGEFSPLWVLLPGALAGSAPGSPQGTSQPPPGHGPERLTESHAALCASRREKTRSEANPAGRVPTPAQPGSLRAHPARLSTSVRARPAERVGKSPTQRSSVFGNNP